jgi:glutathione S-transferase
MDSKKQGPPPPIQLGYWKIRLKCHYLRYLLNYVQLTYEEWNPVDVTDWRRKKDQLFRLNPLVTIPFYKEGGLVVSKTGAMAMAICMRAGRKDLIGNTPQKLVLIRTLQSSLSS